MDRRAAHSWRTAEARESTSLKPPSRDTSDVGASCPRKPGGHSRKIMSARSWRLTCSSSRPRPTASCSFWCFSPTNGAGSDTSQSRHIRRRRGRPNSCARPFPWSEAPRYLIHDRDHAFEHMEATAKAMGIEEVLTASRSPWQNSFVERFIGSVRRECLDHMIAFNEAGRLRLMALYRAYYERSAPICRWTKTRQLLVRLRRRATAQPSW